MPSEAADEKAQVLRVLPLPHYSDEACVHLVGVAELHCVEMIAVALPDSTGCIPFGALNGHDRLLPIREATIEQKENIWESVTGRCTGNWNAMPNGALCGWRLPIPKFNINIRTQSRISDTVPVHSDDHTALRIELARFVGELLKDHADLIWVDEDWQIDVSDETGLILYVLNITAMKTAATASIP
ncbi:DUF6894 family protein [Sphingobium sp. EP60837]|uniref:DUF6894 family protein n=1 Tax=Sphingobium sp. EP60837 TaxID=1855519 RepID=UPI0012E986C8|nr:hypothetical protein [Sphingobium sp. EP60837]